MDRFLSRIVARLPKSARLPKIAWPAFAWPFKAPRLSRRALWQIPTLTGAAGIVLTLLLFLQQSTRAHVDPLPKAALNGPSTGPDPFADLAAAPQQNVAVVSRPQQFEEEPFQPIPESSHAFALKAVPEPAATAEPLSAVEPARPAESSAASDEPLLAEPSEPAAPSDPFQPIVEPEPSALTVKPSAGRPTEPEANPFAGPTLSAEEMPAAPEKDAEPASAPALSLPNLPAIEAPAKLELPAASPEAEPRTAAATATESDDTKTSQGEPSELELPAAEPVPSQTPVSDDLNAAAPEADIVEPDATRIEAALPKLPAAEPPQADAAERAAPPTEPAARKFGDLQLAQARPRPKFGDDDDEEYRPAPKTASPPPARPAAAPPTEKVVVPPRKAPQPEAKPAVRDDEFLEPDHPTQPAAKVPAQPQPDAGRDESWKRRLLGDGDDAASSPPARTPAAAAPATTVPPLRSEAKTQITVTAPVPRVATNQALPAAAPSNGPPASVAPTAAPVPVPSSPALRSAPPTSVDDEGFAPRNAPAPAQRGPRAAPRLKIEMSAPPIAAVGAPVVLYFRISNVGSAPATGVLAKDLLPPGLRHPQSQDLEYPIGSLEPGESRTTRLTLTAAAVGRTVNRAVVTADGGLAAESTVQIDIRPNGPVGAPAFPSAPYGGGCDVCREPVFVVPCDCQP